MESITGAFVPVYIFDTPTYAPAVPSSIVFGDPINTKGPFKSLIEPDATINSAFLAVVVLTLPILPLRCFII